MSEISDLKQWLDSQKVQSESVLSPHHNVEDDFLNKSPTVDNPFVPSPKFKQEPYLWYEDGKDEHPEMNLREAEKKQLTDYEKAKALWYKNAWESVRPVDTEADNSNTFKKASEPNWEEIYEGGSGWAWWDRVLTAKFNVRIGSVNRSCPNCETIDNLWLYERAYGNRPVAVEGDLTSWEGDANWSQFEELGVACHECNWEYKGSDWISALGYNNRKNSKLIKTAVARTCPECNSGDHLWVTNKTDIYEHVAVENENDIDYHDSEYGDNYEFVSAECNNYSANCNWSTTNPNWWAELNYDNRKNAKLIKTAIARTCPQCHRSDSLVEVNKVDVYGYVSVDDQDVEWSDSDYGDNYEFVVAECSMCNWQSTSPNWVNELGYDNRKNDA